MAGVAAGSVSTHLSRLLTLGQMKDTHTFQVGDFNCTVFKDLLFKYQGAHYFLDVDEEVISKSIQPYGHSSDNILSPFVSLLLERDDQRILIDTGVGYRENPLEFQGNKVHFLGQLAKLLARSDVDPRTITHVILSHFHPDHIGGNCHEEGDSQFPHAQFIAHQDEWDFWTGSKAKALPPLFNLFIDEHIIPLKNGNLRLVSGMEVDILPGIHAIQIPGHTPGQIALHIESKGENLLYISDAWLHPLHIAHLDWRTIYDLDHEEARASRLNMLELAFHENMMVQSFHFDFPGLGRVDKVGQDWKWIAAS